MTSAGHQSLGWWGGGGQRRQWCKAKGTFSPAWDRGRNASNRKARSGAPSL